MHTPFQSQLVNRLASFLIDAGVSVDSADLTEPTFLPEVTVRDGRILVDEARLQYPGDLLHEAGHLAVVPPSNRVWVSAPFDVDAGLEMAAIAWSWAALRYLELDPAIVFHEGGYKGGSRVLIENFTAGRFIGVPLLEWMGMTSGREFPSMSCWVRPGGHTMT